MKTIEERIGDQADATSGASATFDNETLLMVRQAPEGQTAYDAILAALEDEEIDTVDQLDSL